jgi:hypothetical protein
MTLIGIHINEKLDSRTASKVKLSDTVKANANIKEGRLNALWWPKRFQNLLLRAVENFKLAFNRFSGI